MPSETSTTSHIAECVYFIDTADGKYVKIGYTNNLSARIHDIGRYIAYPIVLRGWLPGGRMAEGMLHYKFREFRSFGEWFFRSTYFDGLVDKLLLGLEPIEDPVVPLVNGRRQWLITRL